MMWRAFEGANGWYTAWQDADGYHHQPADGGRLTERQARRRARERNEDESEQQARDRYLDACDD
jgi:hypothetical protein